MFRKKKPEPPTGPDAELVKQFRLRLAQMKSTADALNSRGISVTLATGSDRGINTFSPEEVREFEIRRVRLETF